MVAVAVALGAVALRAVHPLVSFLEAAVIAALARPAVVRLGRRIPEWLAVLGLTGAAVVVIGGLGAVGFNELRAESARLAERAPAAAADLEATEPLGPILADLRFSEQVRDLSGRIARTLDLGGQDLPGIASAVGGRLSSAFIVWVLAVMLVFAGPAMVTGAVGLVPPDNRTRAERVLRAAHRSTLVYLGLPPLRAIAVGAVAFVAAELLQLDLAAVLAVVAALASFVPRVGILLGLTPMVVVATLEGGAAVAVAVVVAVGLQVLDAAVVQPRINERSVRIGIFVTVVSIALGASLYGVVGVFIGLFVGCLLVAVLTHAGDEDSGPDGPDDGPVREVSPAGASGPNRA